MAHQVSDAEMEKYVKASEEIGKRLISSAMQSAEKKNDPRQDFTSDYEHLMRESNVEMRPRTIGGGMVDNFRLLQLVMERGGVQAVINNRAFKNVVRSLNIPKSCTSAATVLRMYYGDQLYRYEQKLVHNRDASGSELVPLSAQHARNSLESSALRANAGTPNAGALRTGGVGLGPASASRPRRQAAIAASSAVMNGGEGIAETLRSRRSRGGVDSASLTARQHAIVSEQAGQARNITLSFNPTIQGDRERLVAALKCSLGSEVSWALGVLNVLTYDSRNIFKAQMFPGLLAALHDILALHLDDVLRRRVFGVPQSLETDHPHVPRNAAMGAAVLREAGDPLMKPDNVFSDEAGDQKEFLRRAPLLSYENFFNVLDTPAVDREQWALVAVNVLRNMSYSDRNGMLLAVTGDVLLVSAEILVTFQVAPTIRTGLMDMWINIAPYLNVTKGKPGAVVMATCIRLLDPFLEGAGYSRFSNSGEIIARLAASPERNEAAMEEQFDELLPRLVDMLGGRDRRYINAGLAALCNCSAFDWPARARIARIPRAIPRLISMLGDPELAPRAALTLFNLSEAPSNRSVMMVYEKELVSHAMQQSTISDRLASVLFEMSSWD